MFLNCVYMAVWRYVCEGEKVELSVHVLVASRCRSRLSVMSSLGREVDAQTTSTSPPLSLSVTNRDGMPRCALAPSPFCSFLLERPEVGIFWPSALIPGRLGTGIVGNGICCETENV